MKGRRHTPEQVVRKLHEADKLIGQGKDPAETPGCRTFEPTQEDIEKYGEGVGPRIECVYGDDRLTSLGSSVEVLVHQGQVTTAVQWLIPVKTENPATLVKTFEDPMLEVTVIGPASELTEQEALAIASTIAPSS